MLSDLINSNVRRLAHRGIWVEASHARVIVWTATFIVGIVVAFSDCRWALAAVAKAGLTNLLESLLEEALYFAIDVLSEKSPDVLLQDLVGLGEDAQSVLSHILIRAIGFL